jgi:hypothetical protein
MPGLLVQAMRRVQVRDPVLMIDEIDKMSGGGPSGDPTAAMLEVLDPSQNRRPCWWSWRYWARWARYRWPGMWWSLVPLWPVPGR